MSGWRAEAKRLAQAAENASRSGENPREFARQAIALSPEALEEFASELRGRLGREEALAAFRGLGPEMEDEAAERVIRRLSPSWPWE